ncbi:MAG TPA: hypothetical protein VD838_18525, partial [Anaeromyxobacteraceae bacterium]|nr:hypothetical protein [Anaeromyxobacteraceae bacterium]
MSYPRSVTFDFVPAGGDPVARELVTDAACNACHRDMSAHGSRRGEKLCRTCHYPGFEQGGVTIDWRVMVHQIHGSAAGVRTNAGQRGGHGIYELGSHDFSHVVFAPRNNEVRRCVSCHQGETPIEPTKAGCGACHVSEAAAEHLAGFDDETLCGQCHGATTGVRPIEVVHGGTWNYEADAATYTGPRESIVKIDAVDFTDPLAGKVTFTVTVDGQPANLISAANPFIGGSLRLVVAGPVGEDVDFNLDLDAGNATREWIQGGSLASAAPSGLVATGTPGQYVYTFTNLAAANGYTVGVGVEGYIAEVPGSEEEPEYPI